MSIRDEQWIICIIRENEGKEVKQEKQRQNNGKKGTENKRSRRQRFYDIVTMAMLEGSSWSCGLPSWSDRDEHTRTWWNGACQLRGANPVWYAYCSVQMKFACCTSASIHRFLAEARYRIGCWFSWEWHRFCHIWQWSRGMNRHRFHCYSKGSETWRIVGEDHYHWFSFSDRLYR